MTKFKIKATNNIKEIYKLKKGIELKRPILGCNIPAGFPSPAQDYIEGTLDLNEYLIMHPNSTFFVSVIGTSMVNAGINPGDILLVDRSISPLDENIIIAIIDGELTVKKLNVINGVYWLLPENNNYSPIRIYEGDSFSIWGVVTYIIHKVF